MVLLVGSGLLLISFVKLQNTSPGFEPKGVAGAFVGLPTSRYKTNPEQARFFSQVLEQLHGNPQVKDAAVALSLPINGFGARSPYSIGGHPVLPLPQRPLAGFQVVSEDFFRLLHITLREGRPFNARDRDGAPGVCIVNETFAKHVFPGESAVGKILMRGFNGEIRFEIVGVIADVKTQRAQRPCAR